VIQATTKQPRYGLGLVLIAIFASVAFLLGSAGSAKASEEHQFCSGKNLAPGVGCYSGFWYMNAAYANSPNGPVCIFLFERGNCMSTANEGVYIGANNPYGYYDRALIFHPENQAGTFKVYGTFWTAEPAQQSPPPPPPPPPPPSTYRYMFGASNGSGISSWNSILSGMSLPDGTRAGDFTGDGKADIVSVEPEGNGKYRYMLGSSSGSAVSSWTQVLSGMGQPKTMSVGDFTGDGKADIVSAEPSGSSYRFMLGTSNGTGVSSWSQVIAGLSEPKAASVGDFSGDGIADIVSVESEGNGKYRYMLGKSSGSAVSSWTQVLSGMSEVKALALGDFTGDGKSDILAVEPEGNGKFRYMLGKSAGTTVSSWTQVLSGMGQPKTMSVGDFTGDGKDDIVSAEPSGSSYRFMLGTSNGTGVSSWSQVLGGLAEPKAAPIGDFSGDGRIDIISVEEQ
jgi:hypothetical protein